MSVCSRAWKKCGVFAWLLCQVTSSAGGITPLPSRRATEGAKEEMAVDASILPYQPLCDFCGALGNAIGFIVRNRALGACLHTLPTRVVFAALDAFSACWAAAAFPAFLVAVRAEKEEAPVVCLFVPAATIQKAMQKSIKHGGGRAVVPVRLWCAKIPTAS